MSLFMTFEGIEGSGKTTQIKILSDILKLRGFESVLTREPGGTAIGDEVRKIVLDSEHHRMFPLCELFLIAASRAQHVKQLIEPSLQAGKIVLCDRFADATVAYQGYGRGHRLDVIKNINQMAVGDSKPQLTFLLDCDPQEGLKRARERLARQAAATSVDRFESEPLEFHQRVRQGYLSLWHEEPKRVIKIEAGLDVEAVHQLIVKKVLQKLGVA